MISFLPLVSCNVKVKARCAMLSSVGIRSQCVLGIVVALVHFSQLLVFEKAFRTNEDIWWMSESHWKEVKRSFKIFDELNGDFIGNVLEKCSKEKNDSTAKKFVFLFMRAKSKDYDFATYGDNCEIMPKLKLRDFTNMYSQVLGNDDEQIKLSNKILAEPFEARQEAIVMQKVRLEFLPILLELFDTSHSFCDFRRLLICDDETKCCKCPAGLTVEGTTKEKYTCRLLPQQKCNLKKEDIGQKGVLVTKESLAALCIRNSECRYQQSNSNDTINTTHPLSSVEICQCKPGFFGEYCLSAANGISSLSSTTDYDRAVHRLYPEEIISDLMNLMKFRGRNTSREDRQLKAQEFYSRITLYKFGEEILENDVQIRNIAKLLFGDRCNAQVQIKLDNPPLAKEGRAWTDPDPQTILSWQTFLLRKGVPFCNFLRNLRCGSLSQVCECREGSRFVKGECLIQIGHRCGSDFNAPFRVDALQDIRRFSPPPSPQCIPGSSCLQKSLFYSKRCWCSNSSFCDDKHFSEHLFSTLHQAIVNRFTLRLGERCDPNIQALLLNPDDDQSTGFVKRLSVLVHIANSTARFCRIKRFENCSHLSERCECWSDFVFQNGECRRPSMDTCGAGVLLDSTLYEDTFSFPLWRIAETFSQQGFVPKCVDQSTCLERFSGGAMINPIGRCICTNSKLGIFCNNSMSSFASVLSDPKLISGIEYDRSSSNVFHEINLAMQKLENVMTLHLEEDCDMLYGRKLDVIVSFWKEFIFHNNSRTNLRKAISWITDLSFPKQFSKAGFCDARLGLTCSSETRKCECLPGSTMGSSLVFRVCRLNHKETCPEKKLSMSTKGVIASWIPQCHSDLICAVSLQENINRCLHCHETNPGACLGTMQNIRNLLKIKIPARVKDQGSMKSILGPPVRHNIKKLTARNSDGAVGAIIYKEMDIKSRNNSTLVSEFLVPPRTNKQFAEYFPYLFKIFEFVEKLEVTAPCNYSGNYQIFTKFRKLLDFFNINIETDDFPESLRNSYAGFTKFLRDQTDDPVGVCDWWNYAECSPVTNSCVCMYHHHLVTVGNECRLKVNEVCHGEPRMRDLRMQKNLLRCEDGSRCEKTDFGPSKCRLVHSSDRSPSVDPMAYQIGVRETNGCIQKLFICPKYITCFGGLFLGLYLYLQ